MVVCEAVINCCFYKDKLENMPDNAKSLKEDFCKGDSANCARRIVARRLGDRRVPKDLFPDQREKAIKIISNKVMSFEMPFDAM